MVVTIPEFCTSLQKGKGWQMRKIVGAAAIALSLSGCGFGLPAMDYQNNGDRFPVFVEAVAAHVRCELSQAVQANFDPNNAKRAFLRKWGAQIALTLKAEEKGNLDPSFSYANKPGIFGIGAGAHVGGDATREMTLTYFVPFQELINDKRAVKPDGTFEPCPTRKEPIAGDLEIAQTLRAGMRVWDSKSLASETIAEGGTWDSITHHVTFRLKLREPWRLRGR